MTEVQPDAVVFADGAARPSALTIWTTGFGLPGLAAVSGLQTDALGRLLTDETLTSVDDDRIVAAGDAAAPSGQPVRMSCQAAVPLGAQAADTVLSHIAGTEPAVINFALTGTCASLGRRPGVRQLARKDDAAVNLYIGGRVGARIKEVTCKLGVGKIRGEARKPGSLILAQGRPASRAAGLHRAGGYLRMMADEHAERFTVLRPLLFTIVYEILGSACAVARTTSVPGCPKPLLLDEHDASADIVLAESVSMAMLVMLETRTPDERAVFVLREVLGFDYDIAEAVGKSVMTVRQVVHRARAHVQARRRSPPSSSTSSAQAGACQTCASRWSTATTRPRWPPTTVTTSKASS